MSGGGNPSARAAAAAAAGSPEYPVGGGGGGGGGSAEMHGQTGWYGSNGGTSWPSDVQRVGYPYWYVGSGESIAGGGGSAGTFSLHGGYASYGSDGYGFAADPHAAGASRGSVSFGAIDGGWYRQDGAVDWHASGYGTDFFYENGGGSGSGSASLPLQQHVGAGTCPPEYWPTGGGDDSAVDFFPWNGFATPRIPTGMYEPRSARTDHRRTGAVGQRRRDVLHGNADGRGVHAPAGGRSRSPLQRYAGHIDDLIATSLKALAERGRRRLSEFLNHGQAALLDAAGEQSALAPGRGGVLNAADPYVGMGLEDVRGRICSVARDLPGCQFLARMVDDGGVAAARQVFDEVAGEVVRFMGHSAGHVLVEKLAKFWTDEEIIARVLGVLAAASPVQILAAARNHAGSSILQTLIGTITGQPEHVESFTRTLASVGEPGVLSLIEDMSGSQLILKCLDRFSADQNQFITDVVVKFPDRVCLDRHGCHVFTRCIDKAGDEETRASLVRAVCRDGLALAEHGAGNYVVQHVIEAVPGAPWAKDGLHRAFRGRYVSLARQKASSHVVQRCLQFFSREQADEIVWELLNCEWHRHCAFHELISDPYANYVLQTAMERTEGQMHRTLLNAIGRHRDALGEDRFAKQVFQKFCTARRSSYR